MATSRRDLTPRKDKTGGQSPLHPTNKPTSNTPAAKPNSPQTHGPTTPKKRSTTSSLRLAAVRNLANDVHKQLLKTQTSSDSAHKPTRRTVEKTPLHAQKTKPPLPSQDTSPSATPRRQVSATPTLRPRDKTPLPAQKKQVPSNPTIRARDRTPLRQKANVLTPSIQPRDKTLRVNSSLRPRDQTPLRARKTQVSPSPNPGRKIIASEKTVKNSKAVNKDDGCRSLHETPMRTALKERSVCSEQEIKYITSSTTKEQITCTFQENVENLNVYRNLPEVEILLDDEEPFTLFTQKSPENVEPEEHFIKIDENGIIGLALEEDEEKPLCNAKIADENHDDDDDDDNKGPKVVTIESYPVFEREVSRDAKPQDSSEKTSFIEEKLEEHSVQEVKDTNKSMADDYHKKETGENKVEANEKVSDKKEEELAGESEVHEKQASENKGQTTQGGARWIKGSVVSNKAIEETASKLRDQRVSRVRALAGAFESLEISLR